MTRSFAACTSLCVLCTYHPVWKRGSALEKETAESELKKRPQDLSSSNHNPVRRNRKVRDRVAPGLAVNMLHAVLPRVRCRVRVALESAHRIQHEGHTSVGKVADGVNPHPLVTLGRMHDFTIPRIPSPGLGLVVPDGLGLWV